MTYVSTPLAEGRTTTGNRANDFGLDPKSRVITNGIGGLHRQASSMRVFTQRYAVEMLVGESVSTRQPRSVRRPIRYRQSNWHLLVVILPIAAPNEHNTLLDEQISSMCSGAYSRTQNYLNHVQTIYYFRAFTSVGEITKAGAVRLCTCLHHLLSESLLNFRTPGRKTHITILKRYPESPINFRYGYKTTIHRSNGLRIKQTFYGKSSKDHGQSIAQAQIICIHLIFDIY